MPEQQTLDLQFFDPDKEEDNSLIRICNVLLDERGDSPLSMMEQNIFFEVVSQIKAADIDFNPYRLYIKDLMDAMGTSDKGIYRKVREALRSLRKRELLFVYTDEDGNEREYGTGYISSWNTPVSRGESYLVTLDPRLKPLLLKLKESLIVKDHHYSVLIKKHILRLGSRYSRWFYIMLAQNRFKGGFKIEVDELREKMHLPTSYKKLGLLKSRVILPSEKELADTDMAFHFVEVKKKNKVIAFEFLLNIRGENTVIEISPEEGTVYYTLSEAGIDQNTLDTEIKPLVAHGMPLEYIVYCIQKYPKDTFKLYRAITQQSLNEEYNKLNNAAHNDPVQKLKEDGLKEWQIKVIIENVPYERIHKQRHDIRLGKGGRLSGVELTKYTWTVFRNNFKLERKEEPTQ